jgi:hypothetical protein
MQMLQLLLNGIWEAIVIHVVNAKVIIVNILEAFKISMFSKESIRGAHNEFGNSMEHNRQ